MAHHHSRTFARDITLAIVLLLAFGLFTAAVMLFDVQPVGFEGSPIGFAAVNTWFHSVFSSDPVLYKASEYIGYFALGLAAVNGLCALVNFIQNRGLRHMKKRHIIVCVYYAVVVACYVLFEFFKVNMRPIEAEASYPSSHTLLALTVLYSEVLMMRYSAKGKRFFARLLSVCMVLLMVVMVVSRLICGVHWLTDIVGGVLLSLALMATFRAFIYRFDRPSKSY